MTTHTDCQVSVRILRPGLQADSLITELGLRLSCRATLMANGRGARGVAFYDDRSAEDAGRAVVAALNATDHATGRASARWRRHLAVEAVEPG